MPSVGVFAVVLDEDQRVLCVRRDYGDRSWTLPGGGMEVGESPLAALQREVHEETGYVVRPGTLLGVYSKPWKDDLVLCFGAMIIGRDPWKANGEISAVGFFARNDLPEPFSPHARSRIDEVLAGNTGIVRVLPPE